MLMNFEVSRSQDGVVLEAMGETACLATPTEIRIAVERIREKLDLAAAVAEKRLLAVQSGKT
ncbi:hypothetical protein [Sphingomonas sp.]|uniref:hypothetical protein n=1 Tax=Sphingomonas sp. TaxID=28214 RepID=UPI0025F19AF7|nr:hypothetical protein [Sphingomonas sp.]